MTDRVPSARILLPQTENHRTRIAEPFQAAKQAVRLYTQNECHDRELEEASVVKEFLTTAGGKRGKSV